jgi:hypothetical protein
MKTFEYKGYTVIIQAHHDEVSGPPWDHQDGHGVVSKWERRNKRPGELVLAGGRHSERIFYDLEETTSIAKRDGWGLSDEHKKALADRLGHDPTSAEIVAESVQRNFRYLRGWVNGDWFFQGYTTQITAPDGAKSDGDSCWGFDDEEYMLSEAESQARYQIDCLVTLAEQTEIAACYP